MDTQKNIGCISLFFIILFLFFIAAKIDSCQGKPPGPKPQTFAPPFVPKKSSAELLSLAKLSLQDGRLQDASNNLTMIQPADPEYTEARQLLQALEAPLAELDRQAAAERRRLFAENLENTYLSSGKDIYVTTADNDTTIRLKYILFSRPTIYKLTNETDILANLKRIGFKKVIFTNGTRVWSYDLSE